MLKKTLLKSITLLSVGFFSYVGSADARNYIVVQNPNTTSGAYKICNNDSPVATNNTVCMAGNIVSTTGGITSGKATVRVTKDPLVRFNCNVDAKLQLKVGAPCSIGSAGEESTLNRILGLAN